MPASNLRCLGLASVVGEGGNIEIVADLVPLHHQVRLDANVSARVGTRTVAPLGSGASTTSRGRVRRSCRNPASTPPSVPRIVYGGLDARTLVAQPSVASHASRTTW